MVGTGAAAAAEHEASAEATEVTVRIDFGGTHAEQDASVLVLDSGADPDAPTEADIAFASQVVLDEAGTASFTAHLEDGLDYWLASTADDERYVAMLDGSAGGGDDGSDDDGSGDDGSDGDGSGGDDGSGDDGSGTDGDGTDGSGDDSDDGADSGGDEVAESGGDDGDLAVTGMAWWLIPAGLLGGAALVAGGTVLTRRRRA
ncbi:Cellulose-binding domain protein [Frigoribacterium sp. JB110]|nr:Cellulose-binding domain protein [Frigoribacterium sp. JB110]